MKFTGQPGLYPLFLRQGRNAPLVGDIMRASRRPPRGYSKSNTVQILDIRSWFHLDVHAYEVTTSKEPLLYAVFVWDDDRAIHNEEDVRNLVFDGMVDVGVGFMPVRMQFEITRVGEGWNKNRMFYVVAQPKGRLDARWQVVHRALDKKIYPPE